MANLPFNSVNNPQWKAFLQKLRPYYEHSRPRTLGESLLPKLWAKCQEIMSDEIKQADNYSVTLEADSWTDCSGRAVFGLIYLLKNDRSKSFVSKIIDISNESHSAYNMVQIIEPAIEQVGVQKVNGFVTDNASNMVRLRKEIHDKHPSIIVYRCSAHLVNLMTCDILKHETATRILKASLTIVITDNFMQKTRLRNALIQSGSPLKYYVKTRLLSVHKMFSSLIEKENTLREIAAREELLISAEVMRCLKSRTFW